MPAKHKKFNGKIYILLFDKMGYNEAQKYARHLRTKGYHVRVTRSKNTTWNIYWRA